MGILAPLAAAGMAGAITASYLVGYSHGTSDHEAIANANALKKAQAAVLEHKADLATERELGEQERVASAQRDQAAKAKIQRIDRAREKAVADRARALAAIDAMPECPKPEASCALDSKLPALR